jgi:murein DD-endopeptidase MepM/ murein hydrolase activator NlpD
MSATRPDAISSSLESTQSQSLVHIRRLLAGTLTAASLVSTLVFAPAGARTGITVQAAPAAAFAMAGLTGMNGAIGGVEEHNIDRLQAQAGRENNVVFRTAATIPTKARIAVDVANVRSGPGLDYDKIGRLPNGVVVTLIERKTDWYHVRSPAGAVGWVALEVLAIDPNTAAEVVSAKSTPAKPTALQAVTTQGALNLRRGPGTEFAILGKLPKGLRVDLLSRQNHWYRVETPAGVLGWVTADYLQLPAGVAERVPAASAVGGTAPVAAVESEPTGVVISGKSNLRAGPSTAYASLGQLAGKTTLTLLARHGDWLKVRTPRGTLGWIAGALLDVSAATLRRVPYTNDVPAAPAKPAAPAAPAATSNRWVWPTRGRLTSGYGWRWGSLHNGVDIANAKWTPIIAARAGTVIEAGWCSGYGYCVKINHGDGFVSEYGHMAARPNVRVGHRVVAGTRIGSMGSTYDRRGGGYSTGVHLHFTLKRYGRTLNPLKYLP